MVNEIEQLVRSDSGVTLRTLICLLGLNSLGEQSLLSVKRLQNRRYTFAG
jgi:hypothetical protein